MSDISYSLEPVKEKPKRNDPGVKESKYLPIIQAFLKSEHSFVRVDGTGLDGNYLRLQLVRVLKKKGIDLVKASIVNGELYLEK